MSSNTYSLTYSYKLTPAEDVYPYNPYAFGINDFGAFVGNESGVAYVFSNGKYMSLTVPGANYSVGYGINDFGQVVGRWDDSASGAVKGFLYDHGKLTLMQGEAHGVNNRTQIVGWQSDGFSYLYDHGNYSIIADPSGYDTFVSGINDGGQIVDRFDDSLRSHGFLYTRGKFVTIDHPGASTELTGINNPGQIVGNYDDSLGTHGFLYSNGHFQDIAPVSGDQSWASGINNLGVITANDLTTGSAYIASPKISLSQGSAA